ncbi:MAG TPA: UDP-glucose 4-epimerase GalE [Pyrinomonadaceae bacterium]|nr:UDP-glucose 4-epimerase GalE [Pyrinomonadaceae bacterium]
MILITGGAGYIGSITAQLLIERGERVVILDNLFRGHREAVPDGVPFYEGNIGDRELLAKIAREHELDACIHFAALAYVGESINEPERYFSNNVEQGAVLLESLQQAGVHQFVFSSSCATYGEPQQIPIAEDHPQSPTNPYGKTKLIMERKLQDYDRLHNFRSVALRYFNAAGATSNRGELHEPETHLIPNVIAAGRGAIPAVSVFGNDYPTPDGTAIRDYIHVSDLGAAHILALDYLRNGGASDQINLGNGRGYSVMEVINTTGRVIGATVPFKFEPRRPGDPSQLVANADKAKRVLGWQPAIPELEAIVRSDWEWRKKKSN